MKRVTALSFIVLAFICILSSTSQAVPVVYNDYTTPEGWHTLYTYDPAGTFNLSHYYFYTLGFNDTALALDEISIVFHDISNWRPERTWLNLYLFDSGPLGLRRGTDYESLALPVWPAANLVDVWDYTWQSTAESYDVVFTTTNPMLLAYLQNGGMFRLGIDPDCHFTVDKITVETSSPVPEPITLMLIGTGLLGLAGLRRKN